MTAPRRCPCASGLAYPACCGRFHAGAEAPSPEALMRSRYAGFALRAVEYLARTLHPDHPDREATPEALRRALRGACDRFRYPGLTVLDRAGYDPAQAAQVLFHARVFEAGVDRSFVERSEFRHDGTGWLYRAGELVPAPGAAPAGLTLAGFEAWAAARKSG